ncbi:MAG: SRPBCC family protein [Jatrophihabitantaceae bacterium]
MVDIHHEATCHAPVEVTFAYVDDYRNAIKWMFGLSKFEAIGELIRGVGSVFEGTFSVKPVNLHSTIEGTAWEQNVLIAFRSIKGFKNDSTWQFAALGDADTRVTVDFHYELPGGLAGRALGKLLEPIVALTVRHSEAELRRLVEAQHAH